MAAPVSPTLAGFLAFIRNQMGITTTVLPDNSQWITLAFSIALPIVNPGLMGIALPQTDAAGVSINTSGDTLYSLTVYNLAADNLINFAQDLQNAPNVLGSGDPGMPYFQYMRAQFKTNSFVTGVVDSTSDEGTSVSMVVQEAAKNFTLANLQNLKTPYGRAYLAIAQSWGPTVWGRTGGPYPWG